MYVVEVETSTHDLLKDGVLAMPRGLTGSRYRGEVANEPAITPRTYLGAPTYTTVVVSPQAARGGDWEAILIACQMAACTSGGMPTAARLISWPTERTAVEEREEFEQRCEGCGDYFEADEETSLCPVCEQED